MRGTLALGLAGLLVCSGWSQVTAPSVNKRDRPITINHPSGAKVQAIFARVAGGRVQWMTLPDEHFTRGDTKTVFAAPPGEYVLTMGDSQIVKVVEDGQPSPRPEPKPDPHPDPAPDPPPDEDEPDKLKISWMVWLEEIDQRSLFPQETATMRNAELWRLLEERGIRRRIYDDDQPEARSYLGKAEGIRPAVILVQDIDGDGKAEKILALPAPKTLDGAEILIRRHAIR